MPRRPFVFIITFLFTLECAFSQTITTNPIELKREDGSLITYYLETRSDGKHSKDLFLLLQGSDYNSVRHNPNIHRIKAVLPDTDILTIEKYGITDTDIQKWIQKVTDKTIFAEPVKLSQKQMLEDIDSLQSKIHRHCSFLPLLEKRTNISIDTTFDQLRQKISLHTSIADFTNIVWQHLNILQDGHSNIVRSSRVNWFAKSSYLAPVGNVSLADTIHADYYASLATDSIFPLQRSGIRVKYFDGKYYNMRPFTFNQMPVNLGEEITKIDGIDIHDFIKEHKTQIYDLDWDPDYKQWYSDFFQLSLPLMGLKKFTLTIGDKEVAINSDVLVDDLQRERFQYYPSSPKLLLIDSTILYVCMPT